MFLLFFLIKKATSCYSLTLPVCSVNVPFLQLQYCLKIAVTVYSNSFTWFQQFVIQHVFLSQQIINNSFFFFKFKDFCWRCRLSQMFSDSDYCSDTTFPFQLQTATNVIFFIFGSEILIETFFSLTIPIEPIYRFLNLIFCKWCRCLNSCWDIDTIFQPIPFCSSS